MDSLHSLNDALTVHTNLRLCPAYNGARSCCPESFEVEQSLHFNFWKQILGAKLERIAKCKLGTLGVKKMDLFNAAARDDREQYEKALRKYDEVLDPARHAGCFAALLTYAAGMQCFSCEAGWESMVQLDMGKIVRVLLSDSTCAELWANCESFAGLARELRQSVVDSRLAIVQPMPLENLEMFTDQQALCDWTHDSIAMHPFTTPSEAQREAAPPPQAIDRRLAGEQDYDAMTAGRASGFDITWGGIAGGSALAPPMARLHCSVAVAVLAAAAAVGVACP